MLNLRKFVISTGCFNAYKTVKISPILCRWSTNDKIAAKASSKKSENPIEKGKPLSESKAKFSDLEKLRKLQAHFQEDNGLPIFLKGGSRDQLLYRGTVALCILGLLLQVKLFLQLI